MHQFIGDDGDRGVHPDGDLANGCYYAPTLVTGVPQDTETVQQGVFGSVLASLPFDTDAEAISLPNDTPHGLAASVTRDVHRALQATRAIRAGKHVMYDLTATAAKDWHRTIFGDR